MEGRNGSREEEEPGPGERLNILSSGVMRILENAHSCSMGNGLKGFKRGSLEISEGGGC